MLSLSKREQQAEQIARLLFKFLDLSLDIERNRNDSAHRERGHSISYVLDAGIIELFVNAGDGRGRPASLHTADWFIGKRPPKDWQSYPAQTVLTTTDYLFGGSLPGQKSGRIYMTPWHRWEMVRRLETLAHQLSARLPKNEAGEEIDRFLKEQEILDLYKTGAPISSLGLDAVLEPDAEQYAAPGVGRNEVKRFLATRLALARLASDHVFEPFEQLGRLVTPPLRRRFTTLHEGLTIEESERNQIKLDAERWYRLLLRECEDRGIDVEESSSVGTVEPLVASGIEKHRSAAALWDDARSMALTRWAAARREGNDRLVFLTSDAVAFDVYRRWYADLRMDDPAYAEPFFMRRLQQYTPSFNLLDSGLVKGERFRTLFQDLTQILELMLLPLNLSSTKNRSGDTVLSRMRELNALRLLDKSPILAEERFSWLNAAIEDEGVSSVTSRLTPLIDRWRELERAALGQADDEVNRRIRESEVKFANLTVDDDAREGAVEAYFSGVIGRIKSGSRVFSVPLAREAIERWKPANDGKIGRAPIALKLNVEAAGMPIDLGAALMTRLETGSASTLIDPKQWNELYDRPEVIFAIAAAINIAAGDWSDGNHFAEIAFSIVDSPTAKDSGSVPVTEFSAEIMYLAALAKRFRMGDIGPPSSLEAYGRIRRLYLEALDLGNRCVSFHSRGGEAQTLREIRSYSERAALRLFYASLLNPRVALASHGGRTLQVPLDVVLGDAEPEAIAAIDSAEDDLRRCFELDRISVDPGDEKRQSFKDRLRRQIFTNSASCYVLRRMWGRSTSRESIFSPENPRARNRAEYIQSFFRDQSHPVMRADVLALLAFSGNQEAVKTLKQMQVPERSQEVLNLDKFVVIAIKQLFDKA